MTAPTPERVTLTEAEQDQLTECLNCGHYANEHDSMGCGGSVEATVANNFDDECPCFWDRDTLRFRAVERIIADRLTRVEAAVRLAIPDHITPAGVRVIQQALRGES